MKADAPGARPAAAGGGELHPEAVVVVAVAGTADLRTQILDFRGFDSSKILKGRNSQAHRESPRDLEPRSLRRDNMLLL